MTSRHSPLMLQTSPSKVSSLPAKLSSSGEEMPETVKLHPELTSSSSTRKASVEPVRSEPKPPRRRSIVRPMLGLILLTGLGFDFAPPSVPPIVERALEDGPAAQAGIESGDRIVAVDGTPTPTGNALVEYVKARPGERVILTVRRDGSDRTVPVTVRAEQQEGASIGRIGVELRRVELQRLGPFAALGRAGAETWEMSHLTVTMLWNMVMGRVSVKNISGPINIAAFAGETARVGLRPFLTFLSIVSISLGVLNLLPIPILDGGQMVFQVIEWVKGSPLSERAQALGQQVGIALLLLLMSLAFYNDISSRLLN